MKKKDSILSVLKNFREGKKYYSRLLAKLKDQKKAVDKEDDSALLAIADEKDDLAKLIRETDEKVRAGFQKLSVPDQEQLARKAEGVRKEIETMLEKILKIEDQCHRDLTDRKSAMLKSFKKIRQGKTFLKGYKQARVKKSKFSRSV